MCFGLEPGAAGLKLQTNPLSYGGTPYRHLGISELPWFESQRPKNFLPKNKMDRTVQKIYARKRR